MTPTDHYLLHPVAWAVCQEVLDQDSAMIASGRTEEQRIAYLSGEMERITSAAEITLREAAADLFSDWGLANASVDTAEVRRRFLAHGASLTFRESRNRMRQIGLEDHTLATPILGLALFAISNRPDLAEPMRRLFEPRINTLLAHPKVVQAEDGYTDIMQRTDLLPSQREQHAVALAQQVLSGMVGDVVSAFAFATTEYRDLALVRGALLDLSLLDLVDVAVVNGLLAELRQLLLESTSSGIMLYKHIVTDILSGRISALRSPACVPPDSSPRSAREEQTTESALLSVRQVLELLHISRTTLYRLEQDGILIPIRIGRSVRYDPETLNRYLSRDRS